MNNLISHLYKIVFLIFALLLVTYKSEATVLSAQPSECVLFQGYHLDSSGQIALQFFNNCGQSVNVNVCVNESGRKYELKKSFKKVPSGGVFNLFSFPGVRPREAYWASASDYPPVPGPCAPLTEEDI